ncbi:MAG: YfcE family phosphodiesterase [Candidatus Krumholzibacteriota bacterium]|nr:YfcE family phosphodiesterase [Candidatus Krumholzibacteriota bacterium]
MKIAVMSDTHDNTANIDKAVTEINSSGAEKLLHCGDLCSPFVIKSLSQFNGSVDIVFGNNEGDRFTISRTAAEFPNITLHGDIAFLKIGSIDIAVTHRPEFARGLASTGEYAAVFFGHTHRRENSRINDTWLINPGEILGLEENPSWLSFNTDDCGFKYHDI